MKRFAASLLTVLLICTLVTTVSAVNTSRSYNFALTVDGGSSTAAVAVGDTVTVTVTLTRTDIQGSYAMYAMQDSIIYDKEYFELVSSSVDVKNGATVDGIRYSLTEITSGARAGWNEIFMSMYTTRAAGVDWPNSRELITFELRSKKIGTTGIISQNYEVTTNVGNLYAAVANNVTVEIKSQYDMNPIVNPPVTVPPPDVNPPDDDEPDTTTDAVDKPTVPDKPTESGKTSGANEPDDEEKDNEDKKPDSDKPEENKPEDNNQVNTPNVGFEIRAEAIFSDVTAGVWYADAVTFALNRGLFQGTSENTFSPNTTMTRGMFVTVLARLDGAAVNNQANGNFADVERGQWYSGSVAWAAENGIVQGTGSGIFNPNGEISREQMAQILYNYAKFAGESTGYVSTAKFDSFPDKDRTSDWARDAMSWSSHRGIISGTSAGLEPLSNASRAQVAQIVYNYCGMTGG